MVEEPLLDNEIRQPKLDLVNYEARPDLIETLLSLSTKSRVLLMISVLVSLISVSKSQHLLSQLSVNTVNSGSTYLNYEVDRAICSFEYTVFSSLQGMTAIAAMLPMERTNDLVVYFNNGTLVAKTDFKTNYTNYYSDKIKALALKDPLKLFIAGFDSDRSQIFKMQYNLGIYTMSIEMSFYYLTTRQGMSSVLNDPLTNYVFFVGDDNSGFVGKVDIVNSPYYSSVGSIQRGQSCGMARWRDDIFCFAFKSDYLISCVIKADLTANYKYFGSSAKFRHMIGDKLNKSQAFALNSSSSTMNVMRINLDKLFTAGVGAHASVAVESCSNYSLLNLGSYQYLGLFCGSGGSGTYMKVIDKINWPTSDSQIIKYSFSTLGYTAQTNSFLDRTVGDGITHLKGVSFAFHNNANRNFQSYYFQTGPCLNRGSDGICTQCVPGYYRESLLPNNLCILPSSIPAGLGINEAIQLIQTCSEGTFCVYCRDNYAVCQGCDLDSQYYKLPNNTCIYIQNIQPGTGVDNTTANALSCSINNCTECQYDYQGCTKCDTSVESYLDATAHTCLYYTSIPSGKGANIDSGSFEVCQHPNCLQCKRNFTKCTSCDSSLFFYLDLAAKTCVHSNNIANRFGPDLTLNVIVGCNGIGCIKCNTNYQVCSNCDISSGYYLDLTSQQCVHIADIPLGKGADLVNGKVESCSQATCSNCQFNYTACIVCNTASGYYLQQSSGICINFNDITAGSGANLDTGYIEICQYSNCDVCNLNFSQCQQCKNTERYYVDTSTNLCVYVDDIVDFYGASLVSGTLQTCNTPNCKLCKADYTKCSGCDSANGYFLNTTTSTCTTTSGLPAGFGPDLDQGILTTCLDGRCVNCKTNRAVCTKCNTLQLAYLESDTCYDASTAPDGMGLDLETSFLEVCAVESCKGCSVDYRVCTECYESMGYYLEDRNCVLIDSRLQVKLGSVPQNVDLEFQVDTLTSIAGANMKSLYLELRSTIVWNVTFIQVSSRRIENTASFKSEVSSTALMLIHDLTLKQNLEEKNYKVNVSSTKIYYKATIEGKIYRVSGFEGQFDFVQKSSAKEVEGAKESGKAVGSAMGSGVSTSPAFLPVMMTIVALDPTGVLMKFNQILKIINKLYFININYGTRLTAFLSEMNSDLKVTKSKDPSMVAYKLKQSRGKLTQSELNVDFIEVMNYKIGLYVGAWLMMAINKILMAFTKISKFYLHVMYQGLRAHMIIFNLVFIDFIWFGSHTLMHSRALPWYTLAATGLCTLLVTIDFVWVLAKVTDHKSWAYWYKLRKRILKIAKDEIKKMEFEKLKEERLKKQNKKSNVQVKNPIKNSQNRKMIMKAESDKKKQAKEQEEGQINRQDSIEEQLEKQRDNQPISSNKNPINYLKTYREINFNYVLQDTISYNLYFDKSIYHSQLLRSLYVNHLTRAIIYQSVIQAGQFISGLVISMLIIVELAKITYSVICYVKYKYLKNIICLLMEVMQSAFLAAFLVIALILHPKRFDETILDFYQDAGIWIVIASCVAEYLLLLTYIGVAAYDFFKNRKSIKRALKSMNYSYIKYEIPQKYSINNQELKASGNIFTAQTLVVPGIKPKQVMTLKRIRDLADKNASYLKTMDYSPNMKRANIVQTSISAAKTSKFGDFVMNKLNEKKEKAEFEILPKIESPLNADAGSTKGSTKMKSHSLAKLNKLRRGKLSQEFHSPKKASIASSPDSKTLDLGAGPDDKPGFTLNKTGKLALMINKMKRGRPTN